MPALASTPSPRVYNWTRLRFLVDARNFPDTLLRPVGERLVQRDPKDYEVKYRLIDTFNPGESKAEKKQALIYAHDLIRLNPKRASGYSALGGVYYRDWLLNKNRTDAGNAIAAYQRYLKIAPPNEPFRRQVTLLIALMRK
ncbi:MAG: hypothetical protein EOP06_03705 [Proteobacteria bacterium]|nr:MAG: hypothetical protein EOP06_03705 [Pseudomonadota bacterium]